MTIQTSQHKNTVCPRCKVSFICRADQISACGCMKLEVEITPALRDSLAKKYEGCLCNGCLTELATQAK